MVKVTSLLAKASSGLRFSFGVRAWTEMKIQCIKSVCRLKLVSSEYNSGFKGFLRKASFCSLKACTLKNLPPHKQIFHCASCSTTWPLHFQFSSYAYVVPHHVCMLFVNMIVLLPMLIATNICINGHETMWYKIAIALRWHTPLYF